MELGSFIELDQQLISDPQSFAAPLDPEMRRPLSDLVRNLAPWLRSFPSIREADDQASQFLARSAELKPTFEVVDAASHHALLTNIELEVFRQLKNSAERGQFLGQKAGGRAKRSASNLIIETVKFAGAFFIGAVSSDYATASPLVHRVGHFLVSAEESIESLLAEFPQDLQFSIRDFIEKMPLKDPPIPSRPPEIISGKGRVDDDLID